MDIKSYIIYYLGRLVPDKIWIKAIYRKKIHRQLDLRNPKSFNEKLQWLKLYDRKPIYTMIVDKYEAKKYVEKIIGVEYTIPTLMVWNTVDEIDFNSLPEQFVLKCTHNSGGIVICRDKDKLSIEDARNSLRECLRKNYYWLGREWPYKNVKPRIIAEQYMEENGDANKRGLTD